MYTPRLDGPLSFIRSFIDFEHWPLQYNYTIRFSNDLTDILQHSITFNLNRANLSSPAAKISSKAEIVNSNDKWRNTSLI